MGNRDWAGIEPFPSRVWLSSPTMHGDEQRWVEEAIQTNWVSTVGANIDETERQMAEYIGAKYAVALSSGTAAPLMPPLIRLPTKVVKPCLLTQNTIPGI